MALIPMLSGLRRYRLRGDHVKMEAEAGGWGPVPGSTWSHPRWEWQEGVLPLSLQRERSPTDHGDSRLLDSGMARE